VAADKTNGIQYDIHYIEKNLEILREILSMTEIEDFSPDAEDTLDEAERYAWLYEKRTALFKELGPLDDLTRAIRENAAEGADSLMIEAQAIISDIIELDKRNMAAAEKFAAKLKANIKQINQGKAVSKLYATERGRTDGHIFDSKT